MAFLKRGALLGLLLLIAAACGGGDSGSSAETPATTQAETTTTSADTGGDGIVAQQGDFVAVHYVGTLDDGTQFDASRPRGATLDFEIGSGAMIAGFDQGVRGMAEGEVKTIRIEAADAYGEVDPELIVEVDISQVPEGTKEGDVLVNGTTGAQVPVLSVDGDTVTLDLNHQLAGEALTFEIEMVSITRQ